MPPVCSATALCRSTTIHASTIMTSCRSFWLAFGEWAIWEMTGQSWLPRPSSMSRAGLPMVGVALMSLSWASRRRAPDVCCAARTMNRLAMTRWNRTSRTSRSLMVSPSMVQ